MLFNTIQFALFFVVVYGLYLVLPHRSQNRLLLVASYVFYGTWDWRFLSLIALSTVIDYGCGLGIHHSRQQSRRRLFLTISMVANLGILGFFKYYNFFAESLAALLGSIGLHTSLGSLSIILPVGISFYTFQTMSYTIDIYRGKLEPCRNFWDFALFVAFFPQLVAGPVERASRLIPQVTMPRRVTRDQVAEGIFLTVWGLFKKVVVADNLCRTVDRLFASSDPGSAGVIVAVVFFAFQIYCDFSGYSDIARGISKLMGFELMLNFNLPYVARSPQDFWRRWHISLSTWLRDYLYISLGGNRKGAGRTYVNLFLTMALGGLWHGAGWTFVLWGVYHGSLLMTHRYLEEHSLLPTMKEGAVWRNRALWLAQWSVMSVLTLGGWLLFRASSLGQLTGLLAALAHVPSVAVLAKGAVKLVFYAWPLLVVQLCQWRSGDLMIVTRAPLWVQTLFYLCCYYMFVILGAFDSNAFIYFQF
jgi:D-alanyl-lipoteichoic acid acyltransferase DltB (MBOAT superfamily)